MDFVVENGILGLSISDEHIAVMVKNILASGTNETGGVLIGYYTADNLRAVICEVTDPPEDSRSGRYWFKRGIKGLKALFNKAWKDKQYYLGEWHFHPLGTTTPSSQDLIQMHEIANSHSYNCPEAIMIIIAGSAKRYVVKPFLTDRRTGMTKPMKIISS